MTSSAPATQEGIETTVPQALHVDDHAHEDDRADSSDADSTYSSAASSTFSNSITSSIYNYKYENGRRYHAFREGTYLLPNDETEQERLDLQHHMWRLMVGGALYTAPISTPLRILDLGTGTGIWAIDIADEFPEAEVQGIDLSPIQPQYVPPNCSFYVDDFDSQWTYSSDQAFDFIHGRALGGTTNDWSKLYKQVFANLKPGGWFEVQEYDAWVYSDDHSMDRAPWTSEWIQNIDKASKSFTKQMNIAKNLGQWLLDAGFVDVKEVVHRIPIGPWAKEQRLKELGQFERIHMQMSAETYTPALFTRILGYTEAETRVFIDRVKSEFRDRNLHMYTVYRFVSGRRPEC